MNSDKKTGMKNGIRRNVNKNGVSYSVVIPTGKGPDGKYGQKWITTRTKQEAIDRREEARRQVELGMYVNPKKITFGEFLDRWLKDYVKPNLAPRTAEGYESIVEVHLKPALGKLTLTNIKPEHIQHYYAEKLKSKRLHGKGLISSSTVRHHHMAIHCSLKMAVKWGLLARNAADAVDPPPVGHTEMHVMNEGDVHAFLEEARKTPYYILFYLAIYTGMRRSELLALRWSDVELPLCQVSVSRTLHQLKDGSFIFRQPKTAKGRRMIALTPSSALLLKSHKEEQTAREIVLGTTLKDGDLVFSEVDGKPIPPDHVTQAWRRLARKVGLKNIRLHDARHSHASLMLKQGIHPKIVQERLGHASIQITLDTYSHVAPGLQQKAAALFDEVLAPPVREETKSPEGNY